MIKEIITNNLILRKAKLNDLDEIFNNVWKHKELAKYMLWKPNKTIEEAKDRLERTLNYQKDHDAFFITLKETGEVIGFAGVFEKEKGIYEDTGLCISGKCHRKGYGRETIRALEKLIFDYHKGKRFIYSCQKPNIPSKKLAISLGFIYSHSLPQIRDYDNYHYICEYYNLDKKDYISDNTIILMEE